MPQISKGGKYIFGWSKIRKNGGVLIPDEAVQEYRLGPREKVILVSGSKASGGFVVAKKVLLEHSEISNVLEKNPDLAQFQMDEGEVVKFKGRLYCWVGLRGKGLIVLPAHTREAFNVKSGDALLSIRGSNIAFVMGVKGPIIEKAREHLEIDVYQ